MSTNCSLPALSALILAGGAGRRMHGADKGLLRHQNKLLIQHVIERLPRQVEQIVISCNRHAAQYSRFGETIADDQQGYLGPLSGLITALSVCQHDWVLISPCDLLHYPTGFAQAAWSQLQAHLTQHPDACKIAVAHDGIRQQNLCLLIHKDERAGLIDAFNQSAAVYHWLDQRHALAVDWHRPDDFLNINHHDMLDPKH